MTNEFFNEGGSIAGQETTTLYKNENEVSIIKGSDTYDQYIEQGWSETKSAPKSTGRPKKSIDDR